MDGKVDYIPPRQVRPNGNARKSICNSDHQFSLADSRSSSPETGMTNHSTFKPAAERDGFYCGDAIMFYPDAHDMNGVYQPSRNDGKIVVTMASVTSKANEKPHKCQQCGAAFKQRSHLTAHIRTHTGEKPFSCEVCGKNFARLDSAVRHMKIHAADHEGRSRKRKKEKEVLKQTVQTPQQIMQNPLQTISPHQSMHRIAPLTPLTPLVAPVHAAPLQVTPPQAPPSHVTLPQALPSHVTNPPAPTTHVAPPQAPPTHVAAQPVLPIHVKPPQPVVQSTVRTPTRRRHRKHSKKSRGSRDKRHKCLECGISFRQQCHLKVHQRIHTGEKPFVCDICGKSFGRKYSADRHMKTHADEKLDNDLGLIHQTFIPPPAPTSSNSMANLLPKLERVPGYEKPFRCDQCTAAFSQRSHLRNHLRTHSGEKPYGCDACGKTFSRKYSAMRHMRTHTGEKRFKCEYCGNCYSQRFHLRDHLRTHTGERPFNCPVCDKAFSRKDLAVRHLRTHSGSPKMFNYSEDPE